MVFEDIQAFVLVAQHGSFVRAAAHLCIAQSALSKRVRRLEELMGGQLFERRARGVVLTDAGQAFLVRAERLVHDLTDLTRNLSSLIHIPAGEVRVAFPERTAGLLAPRVIERCLTELPQVTLHVLEGTPSNVHGWLMRGEADLAIGYNEDVGAGFTVKPLLHEALFLFYSAKLGGKHLVGVPSENCRIADLASLPLVLPRRPNPVRVLIDRVTVGHGIRPNIIFEADGTNTLRGLVERGIGMSVFSMSTTWSHAVESGVLVAIPFTSPIMKWNMFLVRNSKSVGAVAISRVHDILEQEIELLLHAGAWPNAQRISLDD